jgi:hypothetical protein
MPLIDFSLGTFTRGSLATHLTGASTLVDVMPNVLRLEDRGDGAGALALIEDSTINRATDTEDISGANWTTSDVTVALNAGVAPDGTTTADRITADGAPRDRAVNNPGGIFNRYVCSCWVQQGTQGVSAGIRAGGNFADQAIFTVSSTWQRIDVTHPDSSGTSNPANVVFPHNGSNDSTDIGINGDNILMWGLQTETRNHGDFPTSYIRSGAAATTRSADVLDVDESDVDLRFYDGRYQFQISPLHSSDDLSGHPDSELTIFGVQDINNGIVLDRMLGSIGVKVGGVQGLITGSLTWSRHQVMTVIVDFPNQTIEVQGATTGNGVFSGSSDRLPVGTVYVGRRSDGANYFWGRIGEPELSPSPPVIVATPPAGSVLGKNQSVALSVTDNASTSSVCLMAEFPSGAYEVVHDGTKFAAAYASQSTRTPNATGWDFVVARQGGWPDAPRFEAVAIDAEGGIS